ncbi:MAG: hypothetical protein WDN30_03725 [Pararobbsia sp.]
MATLVNITQKTPEAVQIWGFHDPCSVKDVAAALNTIAAELSGDGHTIHIMSGDAWLLPWASRRCRNPRAEIRAGGSRSGIPEDEGQQGSRARRARLQHGALPAPDYVTAAMAKLNADMRTIVGNSAGTATFLLAYCCSAGTP